MTPGARALVTDGKIAISALPSETTRGRLRSFLGMSGFYHIWIPNYDLMAYEVLKGGERELLQWNKDHQWTFETLEPELSRAPALGLPNLAKLFTLDVHQTSEVALGVFTQKLGPS